MKLTKDPIDSAFSRLVERDAHAPLVVSRSQRFSVGDVDDLALLYQGILRDSQLEPGDLVAIVTTGSAAFLASFLALRRSGCAAVLLDASSPLKERLAVSREMGAKGIFEARSSPEIADLGYFSHSGLGPEELRKVDRDIAVVKLTSGSTGKPLGVLTPSSALLADEQSLAGAMGLSEHERILAALPLSHSYGLSSVAMPALVRSSTIVEPEPRSPLGPMQAASEFSITFLPAVPAFLGAWARLSAPPSLPPSLRMVISAGAPLPPQTATRFRETLGQPIHVFYGTSETGGIAFDREGGAGERGTVGTPIDGVQIDLETRNGSSSATVVVESPAVSRCYFPQPGSSLSGGRFQSPDLARWDGPELRLLGRRDSLINVRGKKVNPRELEALLSRVDGVEDVVALGVPSGDGEEIVRIVIACRPGELGEATLLRYCREHLAEHKRPRSLVLVDHLPRTSRGKLDRVALTNLKSSTARAGSG